MAGYWKVARRPRGWWWNDDSALRRLVPHRSSRAQWPTWGTAAGLVCVLLNACSFDRDPYRPLTGKRALPVASSWNVGYFPNGLTPLWQLRQIEAGHHMLLTFGLPMPDQRFGESERIYYEAAIKRAAALKLPIAFTSTQWEMLLTADGDYYGLPAAKNPNVVTRTGAVEKKVSPFGPVAPWREVGARWGGSEVMKRLQALYPDPPMVMFISNNEHPALRWHELEQDQRAAGVLPVDPSDDQKRAFISRAWHTRYRALQQGFRDALSAPAWRAQAKFVAYNAIGPAAVGRWAGWPAYALNVSSWLAPQTTYWDGASVSYYVNNWDGSTDYTLWSPQIEAMNWIPMLAAARRANSKFLLEMSVWDGNAIGKPGERREFYLQRGQRYSPERYEGMVQFGMWLLRPASVRDFRYWESREHILPYFSAVVRAVDRVHENPILADFWREGKLVPNSSRPHPYQEGIPAPMGDAERWFLLDTNLSPEPPLKLDSPFRVYALALVKGVEPNRSWLVFGHAPLGPEPDVEIFLSETRSLRMDIATAGSFCVLEERLARSYAPFQVPGALSCD